MKKVVVAVMLGALCAGCAGLDRLRARPEAPSEPARLVARAETLARQGQSSEARNLYARVVAEPARDALHAKALYSLGRLQVDPSSGLRDYGAAQATFKRFLSEYPGHEWESEARAWSAVLAELAGREAELTARASELAAREAEVARLRHEAAKVGADLQRLKRIDLNLERRR